MSYASVQVRGVARSRGYTGLGIIVNGLDWPGRSQLDAQAYMDAVARNDPAFNFNNYYLPEAPIAPAPAWLVLHGWTASQAQAAQDPAAWKRAVTRFGVDFTKLAPPTAPATPAALEAAALDQAIRTSGTLIAQWDQRLVGAGVPSNHPAYQPIMQVLLDWVNGLRQRAAVLVKVTRC